MCIVRPDPVSLDTINIIRTSHNNYCEEMVMTDETAKRIYYIYTDHNQPDFGVCNSKPVYMVNNSTTDATISYNVNQPKYHNRCNPRETIRKSVRVPASDKKFLGYNRVNCSSTTGGIDCTEVSYFL